VCMILLWLPHTDNLYLSRTYQAWGAGRSITSKEDKTEVCSVLCRFVLSNDRTAFSLRKRAKKGALVKLCWIGALSSRGMSAPNILRYFAADHDFTVIGSVEW
jgi:hypothetical protein